MEFMKEKELVAQSYLIKTSPSESIAKRVDIYGSLSEKPIKRASMLSSNKLDASIISVALPGIRRK